MLSGIYKITQKDTGTFYIGSSVSIPRRWEGHLSTLSCGTHNNRKLQKDVDRYGITAFRFEVIEVLSPDDSKLLFEREKYWLDKLNLGHSSYNPTYARPRLGVGKRTHCEKCQNKHYARGLCQTHWIQLRKQEKSQVEHPDTQFSDYDETEAK